MTRPQHGGPVLLVPLQSDRDQHSSLVLALAALLRAPAVYHLYKWWPGRDDGGIISKASNGKIELAEVPRQGRQVPRCRIR